MSQVPVLLLHFHLSAWSESSALRSGLLETALHRLFTDALELEIQNEVSGNIWLVWEDVDTVRKSQTVQMEKDQWKDLENDYLFWGKHFLSWAWHLQCLHRELAEGERSVVQWSLKHRHYTSVVLHALAERQPREAKGGKAEQRKKCSRTGWVLTAQLVSKPFHSCSIRDQAILVWLDLLWFLVTSILNTCTVCSCSEDQTFLLILLPLEEIGESLMS